METYIDDIMVKRKKAKEHTKDPNKLFNILRKYKVKFNLENSIFEVFAGKFLGFIVF